MSPQPPLKIMYLRPVGTAAFDNLFADMIRNYKNLETEVHVVSLKPSLGGFTHIEYRSYEAIVTAGVVRGTRAALKEGFDAVALSCFYDTALHEAREVSGDMIVTAPCIASVEIASSLANRFGIIVGRRKWVNQMASTIKNCGRDDQLSGFYHVGLGVNDFQVRPEKTEQLLIEAGCRAVDSDFAEAIILGCSREVGFYQRLEKRLGVPVIDPAIAVLKRAEYAAILKRQCGWIPSRKWSCEAPPEDELEQFGIIDDGDVFGNRIIIGAL